MKTTHDFNYSFNQNRGINTTKQTTKNHSENIELQVEPERISECNDEKLEMIKEITPQKHFTSPNTISASSQELEKALDNYAYQCEQVIWSKSFDFEITEYQDIMLQSAEKELKEIDPVLFKQLQELDEPVIESIITELSGQDRVNALREIAQEALVPNNNMIVEPTLQNDKEYEYTPNF